MVLISTPYILPILLSIALCIKVVWNSSPAQNPVNFNIKCQKSGFNKSSLLENVFITLVLICTPYIPPFLLSIAVCIKVVWNSSPAQNPVNFNIKCQKSGINNSSLLVLCRLSPAIENLSPWLKIGDFSLSIVGTPLFNSYKIEAKNALNLAKPHDLSCDGRSHIVVDSRNLIGQFRLRNIG